jgi:hypothetical protein
MKTEEVEQVQTLVREIIKASCDIQKKVRVLSFCLRLHCSSWWTRSLKTMFSASKPQS